MSLDDQKARLRQAVAAVCRSISPAQTREAGERIAAVVAATAEFEACESLALYAAAQEEIPTRPLFERARAAQKLCLFPRCVGETELEFVRVDEFDMLRPGRFGLLEPPADLEAYSVHRVGLVLVPGVAFDRLGGRLGRGRGYYDRAFSVGSRPTPFLMGFAYEAQLVERVPVGAHDRRMDAIATENGLLRHE